MACADTEWRKTGIRTRPEKSQKYRVSLEKLARIPEKSQSTKPAFHVGSSSAIKRNAIDGQRIAVVIGSSLLPSSTKGKQKNVVRVGPLWENFLDLRMHVHL